MKKLVIVLAVLALCAGTASAKLTVATPTHELERPVRENTVFWFDDMEGDVSDYVSVDFSAGAEPHFHWDTYLAYDGRGYSWWCGNFDYDANGGYGNSWDDRLNIPELDLSTSTYPILTYAFRHDSEPAYDFTWIQAESAGVYVNLNRGYDGVQPWTYIGLYGFVLVPYDDPLHARFRFVSDGAWSDEDGLYYSVGGAFMCDNIEVFDYFTGYQYFYDSEPGAREGECVPDVPGAAGDYWHLIDRACPALSDPHSWWCGDDSDTSLVPPNLQDGLFTPVVELSPTYNAVSCTAHFAMHFAVPTVDNDYCAYYGTCDGSNYYGIAAYWGDFGQCDGWGSTAYNTGFDVGQFCAGRAITHAGFLWIMYTTDNGCGPGAGGDAGVMADDLWYEGEEAPTAVEDASWGSIKSMYR
jgi:hypothetical protein